MSLDSAFLDETSERLKRQRAQVARDREPGGICVLINTENPHQSRHFRLDAWLRLDLGARLEWDRNRM